MRAVKDNSGQMSIDYLIGITIFILAFIFLFTAIPSMFTPFQSNSDELTMMADRIAATLTEQTLAYRQSTSSPLMQSVVDKNLFDNTYKTNLDLLYNSVGLDRDKYHIEARLEWYGPNPLNSNIPEIHVGDAISDGSPGNQNIGQSRRFVLVRDSTLLGADWPGLKAVLVVRIWQIK